MPLSLTRTIDREHLSRDLGEMDRITRRVVGAADGTSAQQSRIDTCDAALLQQVMTMHRRHGRASPHFVSLALAGLGVAITAHRS